MRPIVLPCIVIATVLSYGCATAPQPGTCPSDAAPPASKHVTISAVGEFIPSPGEQALKECRARLTELEGRTADLERQRSELRETLRQTAARLQELTVLRERIRELERETARLKPFETRQPQLLESELALRQQVATLNSLASRVKPLEEGLARETERARTLQTRLAQVEVEVRQAKAAENRLNEELAAARSKTTEVQTASQQQIELAEQEISRRKVALADATRHLTTLDQDKQKLAAALAQSQDRILQLTQQLDIERLTATDLGLENKKLGQARSELEAHTKSLIDENKKLDQVRSELDTRTKSLIDENKKLDQARSALEARTNSLIDENKKLSDTGAALQSQVTSLGEENRKLSAAHNELAKKLETEIADRDVKLREAQSRLVVSILDHLLFDSGQATIKPEGQALLSQVSTTLREATDKEIRVEGHTDDRPIRGPLAARFPTNWELSAARATTVVRYLIEKGGVDPSRISAAGYADSRPLVANESAETRAQNRRIEIVLYPSGLKKVTGVTVR